MWFTGTERNWKTIEWRANGEYFAGASPSSSYYSHTLELGGPEERIFSQFKSSTRRNINKAVKEGVRVEIGDALESKRGIRWLPQIRSED
jgi:hypothetical protein